MKILIVGDLHGKKPTIHFKEFDAIFAPGDFCSDSTNKYRYQALRKRLKTGSKTKWYEIVGKKKATSFIKESLFDGRQVLEYLNSLNVPVYVVPGNWDWTKNERFNWKNEDYYKILIKNLTNIRDVHYKIVDLGQYQAIGYGLSLGPEYPQYLFDILMYSIIELKKHKNEYEKILKKISSLFERATKPVIFLSHNVPFNTSLDKITNKKSPRYGFHYGSLITREIIEKYQPVLCIGGHIHENFGECKIGKTLCINSGFGSEVNTLADIRNNKIKKIEFFPSGQL